MKSPLLIKSSPHENSTSKCLLALSLFICFLFFPFQQDPSAFENSVGALGIHFYALHFQMGHMPETMKRQKHYRGNETKNLVPFQDHCHEQTPNCDDICEERYSLNEHTPLLDSKLCKHVDSFGVHECWSAQDIRCWLLDQNVWDGTREWTIVAQDLSESVTPGMSWIHFRSVDFAAHLFVFGCGSITSFQDADENLAESELLQIQIQSVDASEVIILSGHSMGAAWATLINNMLVQRGRPPDKRVLVTSGTPLANLKYYSAFQMDDFGQSGHLLLAIEDGETVLTDVEMVRKSQDKARLPPTTLPQFAYACRMQANSFQCIDPQPNTFSIEDSMQALEGRGGDQKIAMMHEFRFYKACFLACIPYFESRNVEFRPNVDSYVMHVASRDAMIAQSRIADLIAQGRPQTSAPRLTVSAQYELPDEHLHRSDWRHGRARTKIKGADEVKELVKVTISELRPTEQETVGDWRDRLVSAVIQKITADPEYIGSTNFTQRNWFWDMTQIAFENYDKLEEMSLDHFLQNQQTKPQTKQRELYPNTKAIQRNVDNVLEDIRPYPTREVFEEYMSRVVQAMRQKEESEGAPSNYKLDKREWFIAKLRQEFNKEKRKKPPAANVNIIRDVVARVLQHVRKDGTESFQQFFARVSDEVKSRLRIEGYAAPDGGLFQRRWFVGQVKEEYEREHSASGED